MLAQVASGVVGAMVGDRRGSGSAGPVDPDEVAALPACSYADTFRVPVSGPRPDARRCLDAALGGRSPRVQRLFAVLVWRAVLGLDLADPGAPGTMAGWQVVEDRAGRVVLATGGRLMDGRMVLVVDETGAAWATLLRHHGAAGRRVWDVVGRVHRVLAPRLLARAVGSQVPQKVV